MGINNGKFYDAEQSAQYYEYLNTSKKAYDGYADVTRLANNDFDANPLFIGITARALKKFIKFGTGKLINDTTDMHDMMIKDQRYIMESFESMVDPASNARIEYDTLEKINSDFKRFYRKFKEIASETNSIMDDLNAEFGDEVPGGFPYPNSKAALASFEDICGGDNPEGGYFRECQNRLVEFDNTMNSYLKGRETPFNSADLNKRMKAVSDIIWGYHYDDPKMAKSNVEVIGNPNIKTVRNLNDRLDMFCGNIDNYFHGKGNDIAITQGELRRNGGGTFLCPFGAIEAANNPLSKKIISLPFYNHFKNYITENARKHPVNRDAYRVTPMESALAFEVGGAMKSFIEKGNLSDLRKNALAFYNDFQQGGVNSMIDLVAGTCTLTGVSNLLANSNTQNAAPPNAMTVPWLLNANTLAAGMNIPITNLWNHFGNVISEQGLSSLKNYFQTAGYVSVYGASFFDNNVAKPVAAGNTQPTFLNLNSIKGGAFSASAPMLACGVGINPNMVMNPEIMQGIEGIIVATLEAGAYTVEQMESIIKQLPALAALASADGFLPIGDLIAAGILAVDATILNIRIGVYLWENASATVSRLESNSKKKPKEKGKQKDGKNPSPPSKTGGSDESSKPNSLKLRNNMKAAGMPEPNFPNAAHHIVAGGAAAAARAREILESFKIDINDANNGVFLPTVRDVSEAAYHCGLHTAEYYNKVTDLLSNATSREECIEILREIAEELTAGTF